MMNSYWPTPSAAEQMPVVARHMNEASKLVFSRSMESADWNNTRVVKRDIAEEVRNMKADAGPHLVLMGSGTIVHQLTDARLVDEYQFVVTPIVLGAGRTMFEKLKEPMDLKLKGTREFTNGNVLMTYEFELA